MAKNLSPEALLSELQKRAAGKKLVLHLACGAPQEQKLPAHYRQDGWFEIRCDSDRDVRPLILAGLANLSMLPRQAVDAIWCSHGLERLEAHEVTAALTEWFRVLKDGGVLGLQVVDLPAVATHIAHGKLDDTLYHAAAGAVTAHDLVYGPQHDLQAGRQQRAHRSGFTPHGLAKQLLAVNFCNVVVKSEHLALLAEAWKLPASAADRTDRARIARDDKRALTPPPAPPVAQMRHPGALWPNKMADELDVPPKLKI